MAFKLLASPNFKLVSDEIKEALIDICGLGYYTLYVNGQRLGDAYLNNDVTNYDKTVYYDTYDIGNYLKKGSNQKDLKCNAKSNGFHIVKYLKGHSQRNAPKRLFYNFGKRCT